MVRFDAFDEGLKRRSSIHVSALMGPLFIIDFQKCIEILLHVFKAFVEFYSALDTEMFVQQGSMKPFNDTVALRPPDLITSTIFRTIAGRLTRSGW